MKRALVATLWLLLTSSGAHATPSTQIWIPSTDIQPFGVVHLNIDSYVRTARETANGGFMSPAFWLGPTIGVLPWQRLQLEVGFDLIFQGDSNMDRYPVYFHAKLGTPEDALFRWQPALVAGIYNVGIKPSQLRDPSDPSKGSWGTMQDLAYAEVARTLPYVGRLSVGYYYGNRSLLVDQNGSPANHGILASWDRTMSEISKKLWFGVDYQGGRSFLSTVNFGASWAFSPKTSVLVGYDLFLNGAVAGRNTMTVQVDINL